MWLAFCLFIYIALLLKELSSFLKKRVLIEKEHLRSLAKLSSSLAEEKQLKFEGYVADNKDHQCIFYAITYGFSCLNLWLL